MTEQVIEEPVIFKACTCGSQEVRRLIEDSNSYIVGCGNPWHYILPND